MSIYRAAGLVGTCSLLLAVTASVCAADLADAIARLLDVGWSITPQARAAFDQQQDELRRAAGGDLRALEASWLVLMHQRRFDEALKRIDEHLARQPDDLDVLRAKTWIQTVLKNPAAAFVSADRLSAALTRNRVATDEDRETHHESIAFLGRWIGYFGGPGAEFVNQEDRKTLEKRMLDRLNEPQRPLFEDARNSVLSRFIEMTDESAVARQTAATAAQAEKQKSLAELQADKERLDAAASDLEGRRAKLNTELRAEMDEINRQDQPLVQQQAQLSGRADLLNADLLNSSSQIASFQQLLAQEKDPVRRQQLAGEINTLSLVANRIDADLLAVNRLIRGVQAQRGGLQTRRLQTQSAAAAQVDRIDRELADLGKRERRNEVLEKRTSRAARPSTGKVRALSAQATAFSTYDTFPLEAARTKLLESLK